MKGRKEWIERRVLEGSRVLLLKQVKKIGGGWFLPIPKRWLELSCKPDKEGRYWIEIELLHVGEIHIKGYKEQQ